MIIQFITGKNTLYTLIIVYYTKFNNTKLRKKKAKRLKSRDAKLKGATIGFDYASQLPNPHSEPNASIAKGGCLC